MLGVHRGQVGIEYAALMLLVLLALVPVSYFAYQNLGWENRVSQAQVAVARIAAEANIVAAQGAGAKGTVDVFFPDGIDSNSSRTFVKSKQVQLSLWSGTGHNDVFAVTKANVTGSLPSSSGRHILAVSMNQTGVVKIEAAS